MYWKKVRGDMNDGMMEAFGLKGHVALITGGGSGLGLAMAECLAAAGAQVVIAGRRRQVLNEACAHLGDSVAGIEYDVTDTGRAGEIIKEIVNRYGRLDILINNAGVHCKKAVEDVTREDLQSVLDVHLFGAYALTQAAIPYMRANKQGSVIFISSMSAVMGMTNVTAYSAAKAAVLGLVKTISGEVAKDGIRVNAIVPGFIDTPMFHQATDKDPERQKKILGHTPMECYGLPKDVGWAAVYLSGAASRFVTGTALMVDGGCSIGF